MAKKSTTKKKLKAKVTAGVWHGKGKMTAPQFIVSTLLALKDDVSKLSATVRTLKAYEQMQDALEEAHPQRVEVEPWKPKAGEYVWGDNAKRVILVSSCEGGRVRSSEGHNWTLDVNIRPATSEEITLYKQEEEARLKKEAQEKEEAKPLEFGTKVKMRGKEYKIACDAPTESGMYYMRSPGNPSEAMPAWGARHEFTIIEP